MSATKTKRWGQEAVEAKGWWLAHKWLLLRRVSQLGILAAFLAGPWFGLWIVKGNLNYSLILRNGKEEGLNFKKFTAPVVRALQQMGAPAEMSGRNDILVDGYKVSGNAIYSTREGLVCHGTLLYDTDLTQLSHALNVKQAKIESKGIKSVRSRVTNLHPYLKDCADIHEFRLNILRSIFENADPIPQVVLDDALMARVEALADQRYRTWEWNYGRSPAFNIQKVHRFPFGEIDARMDVHNGHITQITFFGDYFFIIYFYFNFFGHFFGV